MNIFNLFKKKYVEDRDWIKPDPIVDLKRKLLLASFENRGYVVERCWLNDNSDELVTMIGPKWPILKRPSVMIDISETMTSIAEVNGILYSYNYQLTFGNVNGGQGGNKWFHSHTPSKTLLHYHELAF